MVLMVLVGLEELACGADSLADVAARCCPHVRNAGTSLQMTKRAHAFSVAPSGPRGRRSMGQGRLSEAWEVSHFICMGQLREMPACAWDPFTVRYIRSLSKCSSPLMC